MTAPYNYWLIMQYRYGTINGDYYGDLGKEYFEWLETPHAREIQEGDRVILMDKKGSRPSFYQGYCKVDTVFPYENNEGVKMIAYEFSGYTDLNEKPRGKEFNEVKKIDGYNDQHGIKRIDKLIFNEISRNRNT